MKREKTSLFIEKIFEDCLNDKKPDNFCLARYYFSIFREIAISINIFFRNLLDQERKESPCARKEGK
jgi:hypothetical protein